MAMGQAAGIGAALAIDRGVALRDLDGKLVRNELIKAGVPLGTPPGGYWKTLREFEGEVKVSVSDMAEIFGKNGERPPR